ncbi:MAG: recombinase RecT [Chloroflexota bacterium]|nr:recombinase RecT [Chloroflexota bacterium]
MSEDQKSIVTRQTDKLKQVMIQPSIQEQFRNALGENSGLFVSSLIDLYASDKYLQQCNPSKVAMEALKAATLKLPINKSLGFAYVIPYKNKGQQEPQFQIGYKGLIQLAQRSGKYRYINAGPVKEGQIKHRDRLTGEIEIGEPTGPNAVGYFAMIETINGFRKVVYWSLEEVKAHAKRFSKSYNSNYSPWKTDFDAMATKTVLKHLLSKYGIMSIDMAHVMEQDNDRRVDAEVQAEIEENANGDFIDVGAEAGDQEAASPAHDEGAEPTEKQVQDGVAKKLRSYQDLDPEAFQKAKEAAGVHKNKPFEKITTDECAAIGKAFNEVLDQNAAAQEGPDF